MPYYVIDLEKNNDGYNVVHTTKCNSRIKATQTKSLDWFPDGASAINFAKNQGYNAIGCQCYHRKNDI